MYFKVVVEYALNLPFAKLRISWINAKRGKDKKSQSGALQG
ncbi:hypothetical protein [Prevotella lacticifex]|jgi:hypothetical protein|nr:hypothetical protein [Prevotella lacticifex]